MFWRHPILTLVTLAYLGFVVWLTLSPTPFDATTTGNIYRLVDWVAQHTGATWVTYSALERLANIALFIPVGSLFLLLFGHRLWFVAVLCGVAFSIGIEVYQGLFLPSRVADPVDVATNGTGTVIGVAAMAVLTWGTERRHRIIQQQKAQLDAAHREIARLSHTRAH